MSIGTALGVLSALLIFGAYERYQEGCEAAVRIFNQQMERMLRADVQPPQRKIYSPPIPQRQIEPLRDDERCIRGERFKRLENGWQEIPRMPC